MKLTIKKSSSEEFDRKWSTKFEVKLEKGLCLEVNTYLDQFESKPHTDWLVSGHYLVLNLKEWKVKSDHTYYDGDNCHWHFGPLSWGRFGGLDGCKECKKVK